MRATVSAAGREDRRRQIRQHKTACESRPERTKGREWLMLRAWITPYEASVRCWLCFETKPNVLYIGAILSAQLLITQSGFEPHSLL